MKCDDCNNCKYVKICSVPFTYDCENFIEELVIEKGYKTINICLPDLFNSNSQVQYVLNDEAQELTNDFMDNLLKSDNMIIEYEISSGMSSSFLQIVVDFDASFKRISELIKPLILELRQEKYLY